MLQLIPTNNITKGGCVNGSHQHFMSQFNIKLRSDKYFNEVDGMYSVLYFTQSYNQIFYAKYKMSTS